MRYKDYQIKEVYVYNDGTSDFQLYPPHGEFGVMRPKTTLQAIIEEIEQEIKPGLEHEVTSLKLQCGLAVNLIRNYVETMQVIFNEQDPNQFSVEDWDNFIESCIFLNRVCNKQDYMEIINRVEIFILSKSKT